MTISHPIRRLLAASTILLLAATACSSDEEPADNDGGSVVDVDPDGGTDTEPAADTDSGGDTSGLDGEYAFGVGKDAMPGVFETTFQSDNAKARWDGNTMIIEMDGDAESTEAMINCSAITHLLLEADSAEFHYPNGVVDCD